MSDTWTFGTVLVRRGERVMFVRHDHARFTMLGGGSKWFVGMRLSTKDPKYQSVGSLVSYMAGGWRVDTVDTLSTAALREALRARLATLTTEELEALVIKYLNKPKP